MTSTIPIDVEHKCKYKHRMDYMSVSEDVYALDGEKRPLKFSVMDKQICSCCYINEVAIKCLCGKFICVSWNYEYEEKMSVIEAHVLSAWKLYITTFINLSMFIDHKCGKISHNVFVRPQLGSIMMHHLLKS